MRYSNRIREFLQEALSFLLSHLFIATTGTAALIHSTWSLATYFNGNEPPGGTLNWWGWIAPAFLLAFSIDVGQIVTSSQIANGQRTPAKYATFGVLAVATYYLQWLFIAHHLPLIPLGPGVNSAIAPFASGVRDIALWLLPALLPASTLLYTFSYGKVAKLRKDTMVIKQTTQTEVKIEKTPAIGLQSNEAPQIAAGATDAKPGYAIACDLCDWKSVKDTQRGATNALVAHNRHKHPGKGITPAVERAMIDAVMNEDDDA